MEYKVLSNGYKIPSICFGTDIVDYRSSFSDKTKQKIKFIIRTILRKDTRKIKRDKGIKECFVHSLEYGCNFFDTSRAYGGSERMLQDVLKGKKRDSYYVCTKLNNAAQLQDISARDILKQSMEQLGVDYIDVYLLHWPVDGKYLDYWKQLEELYKEGLVKAIGVSNCKIHHLEEIKKIAEIMPMVDEVELHPLLSELELRKYCEENNIQIISLSVGTRNVVDGEKLNTILNRLYEKGVIIVAAFNNYNTLTYPAALESVIGVCIDKKESLPLNSYAYLENDDNNIDIIARYELKNVEKRIGIQIGEYNSYMVPPIVSIILRIKASEDYVSSKNIREYLKKYSFKL